MHPVYAAKLGLSVRKTDVGAQEIDGSPCSPSGRSSQVFSLQDKLGRVQFFQETFLLANTSMEVVLGMLFLNLSSVDIRFAERELVWRTDLPYTAAETMTRRVELIDKVEFAAATLSAKRSIHRGENDDSLLSQSPNLISSRPMARSIT